MLWCLETKDKIIFWLIFNDNLRETVGYFCGYYWHGTKILLFLQINNMNPTIIKKQKTETPAVIKKELHSGYNEKNITQPQGAFVPDAATQKASKIIDNKAYKTEKEASKKPKDDSVIAANE